MQFNEPSFLFLFLPVVLALYYVTPARWATLRNLILLAATAFFAFWGGKQTIFLLIGALVFNYAAGIVVGRRRGTDAGRRLLGLAITINLLLLGWCKYAGFVGANLNVALTALGWHPLRLPTIHSPPGLSFFTFVAIAYLVDIHRGDAVPLRNPLDAAQFFLFFSRLFAGPIVRFRDIGDHLVRRDARREAFADGARRFIIGLGKKVLIANTVADAADRVFKLPLTDLTAPLAWLGVIGYTIQIYFDFAGYTDMAIGLAALFGFRLPENFNYPYVATSIRDFWRRWHMTLSSWLRDYLYIPLGGSRCAPARTYFNLVPVFFLCGLWHGASWTFVVWVRSTVCSLSWNGSGGAFAGEMPGTVRHGYALLVVMISWVFFRADTLSHALGYLAAMSGLTHPPGVAEGLLAFADTPVRLALIAGIIGAMPVVPALKTRWQSRSSSAIALEIAGVVALAFIMAASILFVAARTYTPFIYQSF